MFSRNFMRIAKLARLEALEVRRLMSVASPPVASINGAPATAINEGTAVSLASGVVDVTPGPYVYAWNVTKNGSAFANGSNATFSFTPNDNGTYVVNLLVTDSAGGSGSAAAKTIAVNNVVPTVTSLGFSSSVINEGDSTILNGTFSDAGR